MQPCPKFLSIIKRFWVNKNEICYMLPDYLVRCQLGNFFTNKMCIRHQQNVNLWLRSNHDFELNPKVHSSNINLWNFLVIISTQNYWASKKSPKKTETHLWAFNEIFFSKSLEGAEIIINHQTFLGIKYWKPIHMQMPDIPELQLFFWEALKWNFLMLLSYEQSKMDFNIQFLDQKLKSF